ncbi:tuftelin 1b [Xyrauchen texanus]|uniref:tuftelin 1b n=1 Tax=Xyrauchen texanus TaxID=154827 RepID=UPI002241C4CF|nr:tuftelin 1b [Xyrauchen texanus]XP_051991092.1 tuftelin 1b [Xyrauchen texanus]
MLTDEVPQVQEVRYCLKTLREQMAARQNNNFNKKEVDDNSVTLNEVTKHLYTRLQEMERKHQEEKERLQEENREYQRRYLEEHNNRMQKSEMRAEEQKRKVEEMQKLMRSLELENAMLREKLATGETELETLREMKKSTNEDRCEQLEKELVSLKNKNHNFDDMLKSQQKKVRNMIEQVQNSRTMIEQRDRLIGDLKEKMSFLEAENREMHDQVEFYIGNQVPKHYNSDTGSKIVYSKPLMPTSPGNKSLPFIKVIEIKN